MRLKQENRRTDAGKLVNQVAWRRAWLASAVFLLMIVSSSIGDPRANGDNNTGASGKKKGKERMGMSRQSVIQVLRTNSDGNKCRCQQGDW